MTYPVPGPYVQRPDHPQAQTILVLGIVSLFFSPLGIVAWIMGAKAKKEIENGAPFQWGGSIQVGYVIGIIVSIILILTVAFILIVVIGALLAGSQGF